MDQGAEMRESTPLVDENDEMDDSWRNFSNDSGEKELLKTSAEYFLFFSSPMATVLATCPSHNPPMALSARVYRRRWLGYSLGMLLNISLCMRGGGKQNGPRLAAASSPGTLSNADEDDLDLYDGLLTTRQGGRRVSYDNDAEDDHGAMASTRAARLHAVVVLGAWRHADVQRRQACLFVLSDRPVAED
ncbi:hypothetical protein BC835DRAFT_1383295 [Cytidiella melzeri]|nr:hypothetical protein BC835DRAFT_1383295 [Cytidiella melzeri]